MARHYCICGQSYIETGDNMVVTSVRCMSCPPAPRHEGGWLAAMDEWAHRRLGFGMVNGWARWYWWLTPFPYLCDLREVRLAGWRQVWQDVKARRRG